ncbi:MULTISPECIES: serine/threonine protein kinase [unclassified Streptomyces]|uniref:serine/threonine-protein kinase n=1 Tax=unclassified Streptomyces TaxID=2593676 RepID=UPI00278C64ED|nr:MULTISPECIES: serine/threonine protein kinase [unclassified Streptomyces]
MSDNGLDLAGSGAEPLRERDPRSIGSIPLVGRLGAGGMGRVYLGVVEGKFAAVKQMLASVVAEDHDFVRRFGQEMDNLARLPAEATAPLLASDREADPPWFATEYVPGITLAEAVERHGGPLDGPGLWSLLRDAAAGLRAVHARDMVHRDLKPSNVMLTRDGVTLVDFGIARAAEQSQLTRTGLVVGTPAYMSPEQASGSRRLTSASDVFALGLLVAYAAGGRWPFGDGGEGSPLYRIVHDEPDLAPVRDRDPRLAEVVASCLDKDPEGRPSAAELVELAGGEGALGAPAWPEPVRDLLAERAGFAARVPEGTLAPPDASGDVPDASGGVPEVVEPQRTTRAPRPERRRRRVLFAVIPVVVVVSGATLAIRNLPYGGEGDHAAGPSPSVSVPASPGTPEASASKSPKGSPSAKKSEKPKGADKPDEAGKADGAKAPVAGGAKGGTSGGAEAEDNSGAGSGSSGGGGTSSGGGGGSDDGGGGDGDSGSRPTSGSYRLKNASTGQCMIRTGGPSVAMGSCSTAGSAWKLLTSGGSFRLYNAATDMCLTNAYDGQDTTVAGCSGLGIVWNWGGNASLVSTKTSGCLAPSAYGDGVTTASCSGGNGQRWNLA